MVSKRMLSLLLALVLALGNASVALAKETEIGGIVRGDIGFVGGDFENVTLSGGEYYAPEMDAYTTYGSGSTIAGISTKTTGEGKLPIVVENGNKVFKLQPSSLANAVGASSLGNAFGFKLVTLHNFGKIKDITGDVTVSFRMKVTDPACLDTLLFAVRPSHSACGQWQAASATFGSTTVNGSNIGNSTIKNCFPAGEWVNVTLNFARSTFYDKADFAAHTWGGSHGSCNVTEANALKRPVFYVRPYFNYGTTDKEIGNYSIYLDDFSINAPTTAKDEVVPVETSILKDVVWTKSTQEQATVITDDTKNGYDAWKIDPAINTAISKFEPTNSDKWERAGQRACVETSVKDITFDTDSWYKLTAYVMIKDGVEANSTLGTEADSTKSWVGKPILSVKLPGTPDLNGEGGGYLTRHRYNVMSSEAKTGWQKVEVCFKPSNTTYNSIQLNATAGIVERYWGEYKNMVLPAYWIRKDLKLERVDTEYITPEGNIAELSAPYIIETSDKNDYGFVTGYNGTYTAYPRMSGRPARVLSWETIKYRMSEPLDSSKNYHISFKIKTDTKKFSKAKVIFISDTGNSATLMKEIPASATEEAVEMVFDTKYITLKDLEKEDTPLSLIGDIQSIEIVIDSGAVSRDGSIADDVGYTISDIIIKRIEPMLDYDITVSGQVTTLSVTNPTDAKWQFDGMLFAAEYDGKRLVQIASNTDVKMYLEENRTEQLKVTFKNNLTSGNTIKAFLWEKGIIKPITDAFVIE